MSDNPELFAVCFGGFWSIATKAPASSYGLGSKEELVWCEHQSTAYRGDVGKEDEAISLRQALSLQPPLSPQEDATRADDLVKRLMHRSHPLHIEAAKRIQSQAARIERLEAAEDGYGAQIVGAAAIAHLREMYPQAFDALGSSGRTSLRNYINARAALAKLEKEEAGGTH